MAKTKVKDIEWYLKKFSHLYYDQELDPYNKEKILAPVQLITPFPESPVLTTDFGSLKAKWIIRLRSTEEDSSNERWDFELELVDSEAKWETLNSTKTCRSISVAVEVKCQLTFLHNQGNATIYSTGELQHKFTREDPTYPLGWSDNLPGKNYGTSIAYHQGRLIFQDGTLRVRVRLEYCGSSLVPKSDRTLVTSHAPTLTLLTDMQNLLESGEDSDITIKSGSTTFPAHNFILSLRSPVFKTMLNSDMVEARSGIIEIDDLEPSVVKHLLNYIYSSKLDLTQMKHEEIVGLIQAGEKYQLATLKDFCFEPFFTDLNDGNCGELAVLSHLYNARDDQKAEVHSYIAGRWAILSARAKFQEWVKKCPAAFLKP